MLKICFISAWSFENGQIDAAQFAKKLVLLGHSVDFIYPSKSRENTRMVEGVKVFEVFTGKLGKYNLLKYLLKANRIIKQSSYDIIHTMNFPGCFLFGLFRSSSSPYIMDIRTGGIRGKFISRFENMLIRFESMFFNKSIVLDEMIAKKIFGKSKKYEIVTIGVDTSIFKPFKSESIREKLGIKNDEILLIYHGALDKRRRLNIMLQSFKEAIQKVCKPVKLLIIGDGDNKNGLIEYARRINLDGEVIFLNKVGYNEMPEYINAADAGLAYIPMVSFFDHQPPLKTLEYLCCNVPVVATNTSANKSLLFNLRKCILTDDSSDDYCRGIVKIIEMLPIVGNILEGNSFSQKYDWLRITKEDLLHVYNKTIQVME